MLKEIQKKKEEEEQKLWQENLPFFSNPLIRMTRVPS